MPTQAFEPYQLAGQTLKNRIVMAPMTRSRAPGGTPTPSMATYYAQRAAWRARPSWYLHVTEDRMIPPAAQASMAARIGATVVETPSSHAIYLSRPEVVAQIIRSAAAASTG